MINYVIERINENLSCQQGMMIKYMKNDMTKQPNIQKI